MIFMILNWAKVFGQILAFTGVVQGLVEVIKGLHIPAIMTVALLQFVVLIMGYFMESVSIMMITAPIFMPIIDALHFDPVWFSALMVLNIEIGVITPPFGTNLFVMKGLVGSDTTLETIYSAAIQFCLLEVIGLALIMVFPSIALFLPNLMAL
jgi:TRAP-type C4-dicarboxylate transport system permease large subunit